MSGAIRPTIPTRNMSICTLIGEGEILEVVYRTIMAVDAIFVRIGVMIYEGIKWVCYCDEPAQRRIEIVNPRGINYLRRFNVPGSEIFNSPAVNLSVLSNLAANLTPAPISRLILPPLVLDPVMSTNSNWADKLNKYLSLSLASPEFEKEAVLMARNWLSDNEIEEMSDLEAPGMEKFSRIITRAAVFAGRAPAYLGVEIGLSAKLRTEFIDKCEKLAREFMTLSDADKTAILNHFEGDVRSVVEGDNTICYYLPAPVQDSNNLRPYYPTDAVISLSAKKWWDDCGAIVTSGYQNSHHPIISAMAKIWPSN